ncbi:MAG: hypothetical protein UGF45_14155 [Massilioclostridium sp.]|nr:hypothetical protein [Massilioclostridium sp.]
MAVTPSQDKKAFWKRIRYDPEILRLMGWENVSPVEFPDLILTKRAIPGILKASDRYICIYNTSGKRTYDTAFSSPVMQIDVLVPYQDSDRADRVVERLIPLFTKNFKVNNRYVLFDSQLGDTTAPSGFYCHSVRFFYYTSI